MVTCSSCGRENREGRRFCTECGASLVAVCPACGAAAEPGDRFCGECGAAIVGAPAPVEPAVERRLVSVLFADLVGFTTLSETRDAEEVRDLLSRYFETARQVVERYGGMVEKFIGDAVMAVWGTPVAQEDDAERAVRAALDLVDAVDALGAEVGARAGVLTGEAAVTLGAKGQGMVAGDLVNTASRIQALAEPGSVLVGERTQRSTEASIAYADGGLHELKGKAEPVQLWRAARVTAARAGRLRQEALEPPFVGRDRELRLVKELFHASADEGKAALVSIVGIAGIGKSRLAWEFEKYADGIAQLVHWHRGRCLAYGEGVTYWALAEMVRMRCEIAEGEDASTARAKLRAALAAHVTDPEERSWIEPRLAHLLALEEGQIREQADLFAGWRLFFERMAEREPVVLVFEDMQWADAALIQFIEYLLDWSRNHAIFVLALTRPELAERHPGWTAGWRSATTLPLERLTAPAMEALLDGLVPGLPSELRTQILAQAEGVPLYAVETVRMLLDRGLLAREGDEYQPTRPIEALEMPETLHALVAARLDGLAAAERRLLQAAAVLGKTFTTSALAAVSGADALEPLLTGLVRKEVLSLQADPRSPERGQYGFLQDLLRQVAYETLPRKERKRLHLAAADALRDEVDLAEVISAHYVAALQLAPEAEEAEAIRSKAEAMLVRAGERAASLGASEEAQRYFEQALELADRPLRRAELHERAGRMAMRGGRAEPARRHLEQAIASFEEIGLAHPAARVSAALADVSWIFEGRLDEAVAAMERAFEVLKDDEPDADLATLAAQLGKLLHFSVRQEEAFQSIEFALQIAESLDLPEILSDALNTKSLLLSYRGREREADVLLRHALQVALDNDLPGAASRAYNNLDAMASEGARYREGIEFCEAGIELARKVGNRSGELKLRGDLLGNLVALGEWDEALERGRALEEEGGGIAAVASELLVLVVPLVHRGELDEARRRLSAVRGIVEDSRLGLLTYFVVMRESLVLSAEGRPQEALAAAEAAVERAPMGASLIRALEAAFEFGDVGKVDELLAALEAIPPGRLNPLVRAHGARFAARRAAWQGDAATAETGFGTASAALRELGIVFDVGKTELEHGEWLASLGRVEEAQPHLDEALTIFERLKAVPWIERARQARAVTAEPAPA